MSLLPFTLAPPLGTKANLGLIVLRTDETIERDFRSLVADDGVALYTSRIPCQSDVTENALGQMEEALPAAASLLPWTLTYDVIGYACTSASAVIGSDAVAAQVRIGAKARHVTDPLLATQAALAALNVKRLGFFSPYVAGVSAQMRRHLETDVLKITAFGTFGEPSDERIARVDGASIREAARTVARDADCDALFLSCTNLRALDEIAALEGELGIPVICSNQALAWHMLQLSGQPTDGLPFGALMQARAGPLAPRTPA